MVLRIESQTCQPFPLTSCLGVYSCRSAVGPGTGACLSGSFQTIGRQQSKCRTHVTIFFYFKPKAATYQNVKMVWKPLDVSVWWPDVSRHRRVLSNRAYRTDSQSDDQRHACSSAAFQSPVQPPSLLGLMFISLHPEETLMDGVPSGVLMYVFRRTGAPRSAAELPSVV